MEETQIGPLLKEWSDHSLDCLPVHLYLSDKLLYQPHYANFRIITTVLADVLIFLSFIYMYLHSWQYPGEFDRGNLWSPSSPTLVCKTEIKIMGYMVRNWSTSVILIVLHTCICRYPSTLILLQILTKIWGCLMTWSFNWARFTNESFDWARFTNESFDWARFTNEPAHEIMALIT